jgi:hypothetical protein
MIKPPVIDVCPNGEAAIILRTRRRTDEFAAGGQKAPRRRRI